MKKLIILLTLFFSSIAFALTPTPSAMKTYDGAKYRYTIKYPDSWTLYDRNDGIVVFKKPSKLGEYPTSINIQTIYTKKAKGTHATVAALMDKFIEAAAGYADNLKVITRQPYTLVEPNGQHLQGEEVMMTFDDRGKHLKQWQVMVVSSDGRLFQAWAYRAATENYSQYLDTATQMLNSWQIK